MEIKPIAVFHSPFKEKFGIPRQSSLINTLIGEIELYSEYAQAIKGLEDFERIWLIWEFNLNSSSSANLTVRPPRLGGNKRVGVFASRSPFRPNSLGLSCVKIESIQDNIIRVSGADLADGTAIYDIKPYIAYSDAFPDSKCGYVDNNEWKTLEVKTLNEEVESKLKEKLTPTNYSALIESLKQDPRPSYKKEQRSSNSEKTYGLLYEKYNITFIVKDDVLIITGIQ